MAEDGTGEARIDRLEAELDRQGGLLDEIRALLTGRKETPDTAVQAPEATVADQVREELARRDAEAEAKTAAEREAEEKAQIRAELAALKEKPPAPPQRRVTTAMYGAER